MKAKVNDIMINYELIGEGACVVLIHGFGDNLNMWYNQVPEFSKYYKVLTYDVRGFGQTQKGERPYSMDMFAEDLYGLLTVLEITSVCVLGFSMGGRIGLEFALQHPEMTMGLILANSAAGGPPRADVVERRKQMMEVFQKSKIEAIAEMMTTGALSPGFKERDPSAFKRYKDIKMQNDPSDYVAIMKAIAGALAGDLDLSRLKCPVQVLLGEHDMVMSINEIEGMRKSIRDLFVTILPTGHAAAIEAPSQFNEAVLSFMKRIQFG